MDLSALKAAVADLEQAAAGVADKVATAVEGDTTQSDVDELVSRVGGIAERLVGLQPPAPAPASGGAAPTETAGGTPPAAGTPAWTPAHPAG